MQNPKKNLKSNNPWHDKKVKTTPREHITFLDILNDSDDTGVFFNDELVIILNTNYDVKKYNKIFEKYKDIPYPILLQSNGQPLVDDKGNLKRDTSDKRITEQNQRIQKLRLIALLKLLSINISFPRDEEQCLDIWDNFSVSMQIEIQDRIRETLQIREEVTKERKRFSFRRLLCMTEFEKNWINEQRHKLNKKDIKDGRQVDFGITEEFVLTEIFKEYNLPYEIYKSALLHNLSKEDEHALGVIKEHYNLRAEQESRLHKEMEKKNASSGR